MVINQNIIKLATGVFQTIYTETAFRSFGKDITKPIHIIAKVNSVCNSKCQMCHSWRPATKSTFSWLYSSNYTELPAESWISTFESIKKIQPNIKVSFVGGEIFLKKDIMTIFEFCYKNDMIFSITSNGIMLEEELMQKVLSYKPFTLNISLDSLEEETYYSIRGVKKLEVVIKNIRRITKYIKKTKSSTLLCLKTMICNKNVEELVRIAEFASETKVTGITFQPIFKTTNEGEEMFQMNFSSLEKATTQLIEMKKNKNCILNSIENIKGWENYFREKYTKRPKLCRIPLKNLYLFENGAVKLCEFDETIIGYFNKNDIKSILSFDNTLAKRRQLAYCKKQCSYCVNRNMADLYEIVKRLFHA